MYGSHQSIIAVFVICVAAITSACTATTLSKQADSTTVSANAATTPPPVPAPIITGLVATLEDVERPYGKDGTEHLAWQTFWVVNWTPVAGAVDYEITWLTSEGRSRKTTIQTAPPFRLEAALGDNPKKMGLLARDLQLETIQGMLSIRITPRFADGTAGASTPWLPVGRAYP